MSGAALASGSGLAAAVSRVAERFDQRSGLVRRF
jgi:hypothetical protein